LFQRQDAESFLGIGTIIGLETQGTGAIHVFSSGLGYNAIQPDLARRYDICCVRGPLTASLLECGPRAALTDGAILSPLVLAPQERSDDIVVVPHWETMLAGGWDEACRQANMTLVDPMQAPEIVIPKIAAASFVVTESLHGAIVADTYGVPWTAFATSRNFSTFKWLDWTRSIGVDLKVHLVPPPDAAALIRFGRPSLGEWGMCAEPDEATAMSEFKHRTGGLRVQSQPTAIGRVRAYAKHAIANSSRLRRLLGYSSTRTAAHLGRLADTRLAAVSEEAVRRRLTAEMMERLDKLVRLYAGRAE
jgi:succinoglycan biosynthesis protein ExoV